MQSLDDLKKIAIVDRELIEVRLQLLTEMRAANNLRGFLDYCAEDIVFDVRGNWMAFPYSGPVKGKAMVAKALMSITTQYENLGATIHDVVIDGEKVAVRLTARLRHRGTSKTATVDVVDFLRFRDGLIVELSEIADSLTLARMDEI